MAANQENPPTPFFKGGKSNFLISHQLANNYKQCDLSIEFYELKEIYAELTLFHYTL